MPSIFNSKYFNGDVFGKYVDTIPRVKQNAFINAGIFRNRNDIKAMFEDQTGGNYATIPMIGRIGADVDNYDGETTLTTNSLDTYAQSVVVTGRAHGFKERDFSYDITGGHDFMQDIGRQLSDYKDDVDTADLMAILKGIFSVTSDGFASKHTLDLTGTSTGNVTETSLLEATQKATGANSGIFRFAIMPSIIATALKKMEVLDYMKYNDGQGIERQIPLATWNGITVLIDDDTPQTGIEVTAGVYSVTITTKAAAGDTITVNGVSLVAGTDFSLSTDTATGNAAAIAAALNLSTDPNVAKYTWASSSTKLIATEDTGYYGTGKFTASVTQGDSGTMVIGTVGQETAPVVTPVYHTYLLGANSFDYVDCGAKNPYTTDRIEDTNGGLDRLWVRWRKIFAPQGFTFTKTSMLTSSPTVAELANASNWDVIKNTAGTKYIDSKAIPFARILSKG